MQPQSPRKPCDGGATRSLKGREPLNLGPRTLTPGEFTSYGPLFGQSTTEARNDNWTSYLEFIRKSSGELLEADKDLTHKRALLMRLSEPAIRTRQPLASAQAFYRNCEQGAR